MEKKKIRLLNTDGNVTEAEALVFTENEVEFGWISKANRAKNGVSWEFVEVRSGLGFNSIGATNRAGVRESSLAAVDRIGEEKFWSVVKRQPSFEQREKNEEADRKREAWIGKELEQLGKIMGRRLYPCRMLMVASRKTAVDVVRLEDSLKRDFREEYPDGMSMSQFIEKKWGKEVCDRVRRTLG